MCVMVCWCVGVGEARVRR